MLAFVQSAVFAAVHDVAVFIDAKEVLVPDEGEVHAW